MPKYRKVTKQVDAWRWLNKPEQGPMPNWLTSILRSKEASMGVQSPVGIARLDIGPLVQLLTARPGDYIIMDFKGQMTACQPNDFEAQYEVVPGTEDPVVTKEAPAPAPAVAETPAPASPAAAEPVTPPASEPVLPPAEAAQPTPERPAAAPPVDAVAPSTPSEPSAPQ